jgi:L-asparaginase / beta-aspartyl-peptidase
VIRVLIVHGGAGHVAEALREDAVAGVTQALAAGRGFLQTSALDAVVAAVRVLEDAPAFNAGRGACMTLDGTFEMDAGLMRSSDLRSGAVAAVPDARDPILLARAVLEDGRHRLLAGAGAVAFGRSLGIGTFGREHVHTGKAQERFDQAIASRNIPRGQADTVGAVALDAEGVLVAGSSTGGVVLKLPGRVGDSPLCGSGFYASSTLGAATATGVGEAILTHVASYEVLRRVAAGADPNVAAGDVCDRVASEDGITCGIILVTPDGRTGIAHRSDHMSWARVVDDGVIECGLVAATGRLAGTGPV